MNGCRMCGMRRTRWTLGLLVVGILLGPPRAQAQTLDLTSFSFSAFTDLASAYTVRAGVTNQQHEVYGVYITTGGDMISVKFRDSGGDLTPYLELMSTRPLILPINIVRGADSFWFKTATGSAIFIDVVGQSQSSGRNTIKGIVSNIRRAQ